MEDRIYITRKKVTLSDGTIKEYTSRSKYTPKKKEINKTDLYKRLLKVDDINTLRRIKGILDELNTNEK